MARMTERILGVVPELRPTGVYLADWLARLVVLECRLDESDVDRILCDVTAMRKTAGGLNSPGGFFNAKVKELTRRVGIPWEPTRSKSPNHNRSP
jgi:hypothetical protein